jgi:hypothetical protein
MKAQHLTKLTKKTAFVFKNVKNQNNFSNTTGDMSQTVIMTGTIVNFEI